MIRINTFLRSEAATLALLALALLAQLPHAAMVFHRLSGDSGWLSWLHAASYAAALEFATLAFVVRGQIRLAWVFAGVSIAVNLAYYQLWQVAPMVGAQIILVSIALPVAIAMYSHDVAKQQKQPKTATKRIDHAKTPTKPRKRRTGAQGQPQAEKRAQAIQMHNDGAKLGAIADLIGVHRNTISNWVKTENGSDK